MNTQNAQILARLKEGYTITPLEALEFYGCLRLGARIYDLKKQGHNIERRIVTFGDRGHYAEYRMVNA